MRLIGAGVTVLALTLYLVILGRPAAVSATPHEGQQIFRFDTYGDEQFWTDTLRLNEALETVSPATALSVGLKVDAEALPPPIISAVQSGQLDVNDPRVTLRLLELNAIVGVIGKVIGNDRLKEVGVTCALCHSTVDNSVKQGIGRRLDGWPNLDLNVGAIVALSPMLGEGLKGELRLWGPGKYDPRHHIFDGATIRGLNSPSIPVLIPPAYGLAGVGFETFNGDGPISYWNSYVAVTQMGGQGDFSDPRIGVSVRQRPDRVTRQLSALFDYQLTLTAPPPPAGSFDAAAAARGRDVFTGAAGCSTCHVPPKYTDVLSGPNPAVPLLHDPNDPRAVTNPAYAARSATKMWRTTPLRALWQHAPYFHDGSAPTLAAVVDRYQAKLGFTLSAQQRTDLIEFLKSL